MTAGYSGFRVTPVKLAASPQSPSLTQERTFGLIDFP